MIKSIYKEYSLIFTDLDGTLLDHDTYRFDAASNALERIAGLGIPLILNSSKTMPEVIEIRKKLNNHDPFIAENGSLVVIPDQYFPMDMYGDYELMERYPGFFVRCLGGDRMEILEILYHLRRKKGFCFTGFADLSVNQLASVTGLPQRQAEMAGMRLSTEPIVWEDTEANRQYFFEALRVHGLQGVQGGRFISISRPFDKKDGVGAVFELFERKYGRQPFAVGLGDSPNDQGMLDMMNISVVIRSHHSKEIHLMHPEKIIYTEQKGPEGWQTAVTQILDQYF